MSPPCKLPQQRASDFLSFCLDLRVNTPVKFLCSALPVLGNTLTVIGCLGLLVTMSGVIDVDYFAVGTSSGIRAIGTVAVSGCLLSAIGYGLADYFEN